MDGPDAGDIYDGDDFDVAVDDTQQPEEYFQSGLSFDNATYDNGSDRLSIQFFGNIDIGSSRENDIVNNLNIYTDSSYVSDIPGAIQSATISGNSLEIYLTPGILSNYVPGGGTDFYIRYDDMISPGALVAMDGSELTSFDSNFWYGDDSRR